MLFLPIPIKAKYLVLIMGALELFLGISNKSSDNVAHFAHLGGMLFGFILVKYWNKTNRKTLY
jgi:membrane associated rhomboid family serine protease